MNHQGQQPEDSTEHNLATASPDLCHSSPHIVAFSHFTTLETQSPFPLSCHFSEFYCSFVKHYSNHPYAGVNKLLFICVVVVVVRLVTGPQPGNLRRVEEKVFFPPLQCHTIEIAFDREFSCPLFYNLHPALGTSIEELPIYHCR